MKWSRRCWRITNVTGIPVFADADTGYGNAVNVHYTVQAYISAVRLGAAHRRSGVTEEVWQPRRAPCLISVEEAVGKYKAAMRPNESATPTSWSARVATPMVRRGGFEDAVKPGIAYVNEAGVDAVWMKIDDREGGDRRACRRIAAPVIAPYYGPRPSPDFVEFQSLGAAAVLYPKVQPANDCNRRGSCCTRFKARGPVVLEEWNKKAQASPWGMVPRTQEPILPSNKIRQIEDDFIPQDLQRNYDKTFGHSRH